MPPRVKLELLPKPAVAPTGDRALEWLATAVLLQDEARRIVHANAAAENLFELSRRAFAGRTLSELFGDCPALEAAIDRSIATGASYTEQEVTLRVPGRSPLHLACTASPVDAPGIALLLEFRRIDQALRIAREERLAEQQQANRELIRNLAHEIKNPLGGIRGAAQLLEGELDRPAFVEYTQVIIAEADRLRSLVNRLLGPHRSPAFRRINVHEVLVRAKGVVQAEFPAIPIVCDFDSSIPEFDADYEQLMQAVLNVVRNAAQALAGSTTPAPAIRVVTRVARSVTLAKRLHRLAIAIAVEDNGPGVPEAIRDRIFFPLVSGREGGSGLGLTIAQTLIAQHGGTIECTSAPGKTVFQVLLPLSLDAPNGGPP
ncbi:MAG TPA: nitrogen regulation protein NR(II) [Casimicrobiaceae bacterium]|nr:nitrogen regulation protein NR(II) [Casimicrobiaceae bacterium]